MLPSLTEGTRPLELFTDRYDHTKRFLAYLHGDVLLGRVLFFYGEGGSGKSLLLRYLNDNFCKLLSAPEWTAIQALPADETVKQSKAISRYTPVPHAFVDCSQLLDEQEDPEQQDPPVNALLTLRWQLVAQGVNLKLFDYTVVTYLNSIGKAMPDYLRRFYLPEELDFLTSLWDTFASTGGIAGILNTFISIANKHTNQWC